MMQKKISWWRGVAIAVDQLWNAICHGNPDSTISARTGYLASRGSQYWAWLERFINWAFYPVDGPGHCWQAFEGDKNESFFDVGWRSRFGLALIVFFTCPFIGLVLRLRAWLQRVRKR